MKEESSLFVGIDVSKDRLDVAVRPTGEAWQVSPRLSGYQPAGGTSWRIGAPTDSAGSHRWNGNGPGGRTGRLPTGYSRS